jgi:hypothetical protein
MPLENVRHHINSFSNGNAMLPTTTIIPVKIQ